MPGPKPTAWEAASKGCPPTVAGRPPARSGPRAGRLRRFPAPRRRDDGTGTAPTGLSGQTGPGPGTVAAPYAAQYR